VRAYGITTHRHRPEIEMGLGLATSQDRPVVFTPHLVPMQRGLLATVTIPVADGVGSADLHAALEDRYSGAPFVSVLHEPPQTRWVVGSNRALVAGWVDEGPGVAIVQCAIDNLLKGAAGQAVQAANLVFGLDETTGLPFDGWMP
jgi:N-acetyl-gamma-glutamyl-phosphate reductase